MIIKIKKRDGREVPFNIEKIADAIFKAAQAVGGQDYNISLDLAEKVTKLVEFNHKNLVPTVEDIQDNVEKVLIEEGHAKTAKEYILYRADRNRIRDMNTRLMRVFEGITFNDEKSNLTSIDKMFSYGTESAKEFYDLFVLNPDHSKAHKNRDIFIHDLEYLMLSINSCFLDLTDVIKDGFYNGGLKIQRPILIEEYLDFIIMIIHLLQKDLHGEKSIANFDFLLEKAVIETYKEEYRKNLKKSFYLSLDRINLDGNLDNIFDILENEYNLIPRLQDLNYIEEEKKYLKELIMNENLIDKIQMFTKNTTEFDIENRVSKSLAQFIDKLNIINPKMQKNKILYSLNIGTNISREGRLINEKLIDILDERINLNCNIFIPEIIFKIKDGINLNKEDLNNDILMKMIQLCKKNISLKFIFLDSSYNLKYYNIDKIFTEVSYMASNARIMENIFDKKRETSIGRGNLSYTTLNLPRIGLENRLNLEGFFRCLDERIDLVISQLLERFEMQSNKLKSNFPVLMGEGIWINSERLKKDDNLRNILKEGTLAIGFVGLAECLSALIDKHHAQSKKAQELGIKIVKHMKDRIDDISRQYDMNFTLMGVSDDTRTNLGFVEKDREYFGNIEGITNLNHYTNSFHIPKKYNIDILNKIKIESEYHKYTNGGHILDLEISNEEDKYLYEIFKYMRESDIGFCSLSINNN